VGDGKIGPLTAGLQAEYEKALRGKNPMHSDWLAPVYDR
jgi:hypothetical protein